MTETKNKASENQSGSKSAEALDYPATVAVLKEMTEIQCSHGNWDYDAYMHGMANGMIFALSLFGDKRPEYLEAPDVWGEDMPDTSKLETEGC